MQLVISYSPFSFSNLFFPFSVSIVLIDNNTHISICLRLKTPRRPAHARQLVYFALKLPRRRIIMPGWSQTARSQTSTCVLSCGRCTTVTGQLHGSQQNCLSQMWVNVPKPPNYQSPAAGETCPVQVVSLSTKDPTLPLTSFLEIHVCFSRKIRSSDFESKWMWSTLPKHWCKSEIIKRNKRERFTMNILFWPDDLVFSLLLLTDWRWDGHRFWV